MKYLLMSLVALTLFSCQKQQKNNLTTSEAPVSSSTLTLNDIKIEQGMMVFKDGDHLTNCRNLLSNMSPDEILSWENSIGFKSVMSVLLQAQHDLQMVSEKYPDNDVNELSYQAFVNDIKPLIEKYKDYMEIDGNGNIVKQYIFDPSTAWLSNTSKMLVESTNIRYYSDDRFILVRNKDLSKMSYAIGNPSATNSDGVYISKVETTILKKSRGNFSDNITTGHTILLGSTDGETTCSSSSKKARTSFYLKLYAVYVPPSWPNGAKVEYSLNYNGYNQRKALIGWQNTFVDTYVQGTYYSSTPNVANIHYYNGPLIPPYAIMPYSYGYTHSAVTSYGNTLGVFQRGVHENLSIYTYDFTANFTVSVTHINGCSLSLSL